MDYLYLHELNDIKTDKNIDELLKEELNEASRAVDALITYRIIKLLVTPFERQEAYKYGIIDDKGKVLKKAKTLKTEREKKSIYGIT